MEKNLRIIFNIILLFPYLICIDKIEENDGKFINISYYSKKVGKKGAIDLSCDRNFNVSLLDGNDIEEKSRFNTTCFNFNNKETYNLNCSLWKYTRFNYDRIYILCNITESLPKGVYKLNINNTVINYYGGITIKSNRDINFTKLDENIPFIYSNEQIINIEEDGKDSYEIKFKTFSYYHEKIFLNQDYIYIHLKNCNEKNNELICNIPRLLLEETMEVSNRGYHFTYLPNPYIEETSLLVPDIQINSYINKKNIYVGITKLLTNNIRFDSIIVYETNVTDISLIRNSLNSFRLGFNDNKVMRRCGFRKYDDAPLLIVCFIDSKDKVETLSLEIKEPILLDNSSIKYNFLIQPFQSTEIIKIDSSKYDDLFILLSIPEVLDFTSKDNLTVEFIISESNKIISFTLNNESSDLECENIEFIKKCIVPKTHFNGKGSGYYFTYYKLDSSNEYIKDYLNHPFKVILPESNSSNSSNSSNNAGLIILIIIIIIIILIAIFLVFHFYRKRTSSDINKKDEKIMNFINQIE